MTYNVLSETLNPTQSINQSIQRTTCSTFQTCILNSHYCHIMCGSMVVW